MARSAPLSHTPPSPLTCPPPPWAGPPTKGDTVIIGYNDKHYCIDIMEVRSARGGEPAAQGGKAGPPSPLSPLSIPAAVCIIDTDVEVDFERPADMPVRDARGPMAPPPPRMPSSAREAIREPLERGEGGTVQRCARIPSHLFAPRPKIDSTHHLPTNRILTSQPSQPASGVPTPSPISNPWLPGGRSIFMSRVTYR